MDDHLAALAQMPGSLVDYPCPCPSMPRNYWHHPVTDWDPVGLPLDGGDPVADAAAYLAGGWDGWAIACPDCAMV